MGRGDIGRSPTRSDPIVLTRNTKEGRFKRRTWLDYSDTPETKAMRRDMVRINEHLAAATIAFEHDGLAPPDLGDRWLSRRFVVQADQGERFDFCGRLFGGFFQTLSKERRHCLRIDGETTVTLDYSSAFLRIALAEYGAVPRGDLYAIPGTEELTRSQIKAAVSALFFASPRMSRWPREFTEGPGGFPAEWTPRRLRELLLGQYLCLADAFATRAGYRYMATESRMLVQLLLALAERGITALPLHDAVVVAATQAEVTKHLMEEVSLVVTGSSIPVQQSLLQKPLPSLPPSIGFRVSDRPLESIPAPPAADAQRPAQHAR
jgi:hypothetical protein